MASPAIDEIYTRMNDDIEFIEPEVDPKESQICKFYAGKTILLTGATGFMGKAYVEKILRSCPDLKKLYVIVRQKRGVPPEEKMQKYFQNMVFDRLRSIYPNVQEKVVTIRGDLQEDRLGISDEDRQMIIDNVDIVVHNGATVKFDEIINVSLRINVLATKHMLDLAMECKHIQAFIYVSTAYSHCYRQDIEEKFYEAPADLETVNDMIKTDMATIGLSQEAMHMLLGKWPNIYTFTKSMAEDLVRQYGERANFGCGVFRPSIVTASNKEPVPGWLGNNNGPGYVFMGIGLGAVHCCYIMDDAVMDLVPVDMSINALIAATYDLPERWKIEKGAVVYNYGSSKVNPFPLKEIDAKLMEECRDIGSTKMMYKPFVFMLNRMWLFWIAHIFLHFFPAVLADTALLLMRKKPMALSLFWLGTKHMSKIIYFMNGGWRIHIPEMMKVHDKLNITDQKLFPFDIRSLNWILAAQVYIRATRVYVLKESMDKTEESRRWYRILNYAHYTLMTVIGLVVVYYLTRLFNCLSSAIV